MGDFPYSRPPRGRLPEVGKAQIRTALESAGMAGKAGLVLGTAAA